LPCAAPEAVSRAVMMGASTCDDEGNDNPDPIPEPGSERL
jgi:hypothetical protein